MEATSSYFFGRTIIESSVSQITRENVLAQLKKAKVTHDTNSRQIDYLYKYYKGNQPILYRTKTVRPEINNKIVENHAFEIVDFKKGYVFGEPIQYVRRGEADGISEKITTLNEYMFAEDKHSGDRDLAEWFYICGTAYRMILPDAQKAQIDEAPFEIDCLDPRYAFVVYSNSFGRRPLMGVKYIVNEDKSTLYSVYTPTEYFEILDNKILNVSGPHTLGDIPIIEYPANPNRIGAFEVVLGLLDAMNSTVSNRLDAIDQFVQSFMKFVNCDIDETTFTALKQLGALKIRSDNTQPADVDIVSSELDQAQTQISKDDLYQMVLIICGMPDRNGGNKSTGDTGQAVILRDGWGAAVAKAKDCELSF
jgi:SPP1 family phage portal protein